MNWKTLQKCVRIRNVEIEKERIDSDYEPNANEEVVINLSTSNDQKRERPRNFTNQCRKLYRY